MAKRKKVKGLGDVIAKVTEAIGIEPCDGCNERKEVLNKLFPFGVEELTTDEKEYLTAFFETDKVELSTVEQKELLNIYFRAYRVAPFAPCIGCSGVWKSIVKKLKKLDYESI